MAFSKDPNTFPAEFAGLFRRALNESFELDLEERGTAINYCHRLHAYRRAIEETRTPGFTQLRSVIISLRGTRLLFTNTNKAMKTIREAVGKKEPSTEEIDDYLAELEKNHPSKPLSSTQMEIENNAKPRSDVREATLGKQSTSTNKEEEAKKDWQDIFGIKSSTSATDQE